MKENGKQTANQIGGKVSVFILAFTLLAGGFITEVLAALQNTQANQFFTQNKIPTGTAGNIMSVTFTFTADRDYDAVWIGIAYDDQVNSDDKEEKTAIAYPFEVSMESLKRKNIGRMKEGQSRSVSLSARVRRDIPEGYYGVKVYAADSEDGAGSRIQEYVNVWIKKPTSTETTAEDTKNVSFVVGEDQTTPFGTFPNVMNFSVNLRNQGKVTAQDVVVSMVMDKDPAVFPFDINETNYDRRFEKIAHEETVSLDYSFAIRKDTYTGYYPIKLKISYRESSDGAVKTAEHEFYVNVKGKEKVEEEKKKDFNPNSSSKSRIIVESYRTEPEHIFAGEDFELIVVMKNASESIPTSNILFTFESEKISESAVFSTEAGAGAIVVNSLAGGASEELRIRLSSRPTLDQRSYGITIREKYDSPDFKNAEESVQISIPIHQEARLGIGSVEIYPETIKVGDEANVIFPINNTGRVTLYNVSVRFEADSIKENEQYIGNIEAGKTGNLDKMLTGIAGSTDDGKVNIIIRYEDENGKESTVEKSINILVEEPPKETGGEEWMKKFEEENLSEEPAPWYKNGLFVIPAILLVLLGITAVILILRRRRNKEMGE